MQPALKLKYLFSGMNPEAIQRVAQNLPTHMLHSLSQVASQTPHYPHTPGGGATAYAASVHTYANTVSVTIVVIIIYLFQNIYHLIIIDFNVWNNI